MRTWNRKASSIFLGLAMAVGGISLISSGDAYASGIQVQPPEKIFAASCSTCHGGLGKGGVTWVRDADEALGEREAPAISGIDFNRDGVINNLDANYIKMKVRNGSNNGAMPAFGKEEIRDSELTNLADKLIASQSDGQRTTNLVPTVSGNEIRLDILDADPWYTDRGADNTADPLSSPEDLLGDHRRVVLVTGDYLKVVNTGRTWHTLTHKGATPATSYDSGFIGYAGNHHNIPGDLDQGVPAGIGYYYAEQGTDLTTTSCARYLCKMHPYMQVEVCTTGNAPAGPSAVLGLTRAHKHPLPAPTTLGAGEVWVTTQSQELSGEETVDTDPGNDRSVIGMDGTYQVIDAGTAGWPVSFVTDKNNVIANVGNNPHNAWPSKDSAGNDVVLSASWHDNTISLMNAAGDADEKKILMERRSGATNAHVITMPTGVHGEGTGRFFISHMGGRAIQEINADDLRLGNDPNVPGRLIRGNTGPHGLWSCDDGKHILTADTFGGSATWYNIDTKKRSTASSGGAAPLAPAIFSATGSPCITGFTNNATTPGGGDVSVYDMTGDTIKKNDGTNIPGAPWASIPLSWLWKNGNDNIQLRNTTDDQTAPGGAPPVGVGNIKQVRWVHLPIQTPVSPANATGHGRYIVTANKASFNVSVTKLDTATGVPLATYTFPAGLGAHGVTYGKKSACEYSGGTCYYAYVTNTLEDYVSVYDLEQIDTNNDGTDNNASGVGMQGPGSALLSERLYVEGGAVEAVIAIDPFVAGLCDVLDVTSTGLCGDSNPGTGVLGGADVARVVGGLDICLDTPGGTDPGVDGDGAAGVLQCGIGPLGLYVANLPMGVLCPDCRSGVHVGDIPLTLTTGAALAGSSTPGGWCDAGALGTPDCPSVTNSGASSKYTYLKEEVWVDTDTIACALGANDCDGATINGTYGGNTTSPGTINTQLTLDLDLGINTGGQGIVARNPVNGRSPSTPWTP